MGGSLDDETLQTATPSSAGPVRPSALRIKTEGTQLGRYTIRRLLGRGGVGAVYEAQDTELDRLVALKVLRDDRSDETAGIRREAQALARLVHQNVIMVYDVGVHEDEVFLVMQLVEGVTIDAWIAKHKPSVETILAMFDQAGQGLAGAHAVDLIHCDFKPTNVLVDAKGVVRVGDFGLARRTHAMSLAPAVELTPIADMTTVAGTPAYMAPEQFSATVTAASDQFAFCVALWECLAGERPYADSVSPVLELAARGERRPLPRGVRVPRHVMRAIDRGMARDPSDRFPSMTALLEALKPPRRVLLIATLAATIGVLAGGVVAYLVFAREPAKAWGGADVDRAQTLTSYGKDACAYGLTVESGEHVVFDRTQGDAVDLYELPLAGGAPRQLTNAPSTWEWRAQPGRRPGEVIHLVHDQEDPAKSHIAFLDLATGKSTRVLETAAWDATVAGDVVYFTPTVAGGIRVFHAGTDRPFLTPAANQKFFLIAASPTGDRLALTVSTTNGTDGQPCLVNTTTLEVHCLPYETLSRPVFSPDGRVLYFGTYDGIVRHELDSGRSILAVKGVYTESIAIAPRGNALIYSTCSSHTQLQDFATGQPVLANEQVLYATESASGLLAWVEMQRGTRVLVVRSADGRIVQLTTAALGNVWAPAFSPDGKNIVFGTDNGLRIASVEDLGVILQITANGRDHGAVWTTGNLIAFSRDDENGGSQAFVTTRDGSNTHPLADATRTVYGARGNELLVGGPDAMLWLDPVTGAERPGPRRPPGKIYTASVSFSGRWVTYQIGELGQEIWRVDGDGEPERLRTMQAGETADSLIIRDDGHILGIVGKYWGDLVRVPPKGGARF